MPGNNKYKNKRNNGKWGGNKRKKNNWADSPKAKQFRRDYEDGEPKSNQTPHQGSYVNAELRKLLGIPEPIVKEDKKISPDDAVKAEDDTKSESKQEVTEGGEPDAAEDGTKSEIKKEATEGGEPDKATPETSNDKQAATEESTKAPKRKLAFLFSYIGQNYCGMAMNENKRTIQSEFEYALYQAGYLEEANFGFPFKYGWSSAARTDKGVHCCAQVCSAKIRVNDPDASDMGDVVRETLNKVLPADIRLLDVIKTTRAFCAKTSRDKVRYQYMIPSFTLMNQDELHKTYETHASSITSVLKNATHTVFQEMGRKSLEDPLSEKEKYDLYAAFAKHRATTEQISKLNEALNVYKGTLSYHNFTRGKTAADQSSKRYILSFDVVPDDTTSTVGTIVDDNGMEWITTQVVGQSFLLNQIRKMIAVALDVARDAATLDQMKDAFSKRRMNTDIAPAQGLFLDIQYYEKYNRRNTNLEDLDWTSNKADLNDEFDSAVKRWSEFKNGKVVPFIMEQEKTEFNFITYMLLHEFKYDLTNYLPVDDTEEDQEEKNDVNDKKKEADKEDKNDADDSKKNANKEDKNDADDSKKEADKEDEKKIEEKIVVVEENSGNAEEEKNKEEPQN